MIKKLSIEPSYAYIYCFISLRESKVTITAGRR